MSTPVRRVRPRGVEQVGLGALEKLGLPALLADLGVNGAPARGLGRRHLSGVSPIPPRSARRTAGCKSAGASGLGVDFETVGAIQLYRASDALVRHREAVETHRFDRAMGLFDLQPTVTLYDLTNTYFEGESGEQRAQRGHSKETRSRLLPLVRRSKVFAGNVREQRTLAGMLDPRMGRHRAVPGTAGPGDRSGARRRPRRNHCTQASVATPLSMTTRPPGGAPSASSTACVAETDWDEDTPWRTYTSLTDVEAVFRSLKSEPRLRGHGNPARFGPRCAASSTASKASPPLFPAPRRARAARANGHASRTRAAGHLRA